MASRLISAVRHSNRKAAITTITSTQPSSSARVRLSNANWMKSAGRKMVESIFRPGRPGRSSSSAVFHAVRRLQRIGPGIFFHDEHQPGAVVDDRVAEERPGVLDHVGHVAQDERRAVALLFVADGHLGQVLRRLDRLRPAGC